MHRTQISLEHEQYRRLGAEARRRGVSLSALIRSLVDRYLHADDASAQDPLEAVIGIGSGTGDPVGREHNRYLYRATRLKRTLVDASVEAPRPAVAAASRGPKRIFVDTSVWYALVDARDPDHDAVVTAVREHRGRLVTSNYVLDETLTLARYRLGWTVAHALGLHLRDGGLAGLERVSPRDEEAAWSIFSSYSDKSFSFTDCTSFALCRRLGLSTCLALDRDFRAFGLHCLP